MIDNLEEFETIEEKLEQAKASSDFWYSQYKELSADVDSIHEVLDGLGVKRVMEDKRAIKLSARLLSLFMTQKTK